MKDLDANSFRHTASSRRVRGVLGILAGLGLAPWLAAAPVDFARDIQPLLAEHCVRCHGEEQQKGGLRLDAAGPARQGGDSGPAFVPGRSADSRLLQLVAGTDPKKVMPPKGPRLTAAQVDLVRRWIDGGAAWPDDDGAAPVRSRHWSFQPLRSSADLAAALPALPRAGSTLDAFILARLATNGLALSPPADRRTWIRRLSFDLTGLPPTPAEIDAFVADRSPRAYEALVERLLASPRHGERWGRHWLDVVRYTESHGFEYDKLRDNAWHYRDYVIRSFNEDKPYDRFMREQIAGDVLEPVTSEGIVATSLLVCGPWDEAGSSQANVAQRMLTREEEMEDLVGTVGQTFLGVTLNCARCHSHKFDPIPLEEYYRVRSVFDGVRHGERSILSASEARAREERKAALEREVTAAQAVAARLEAEGGRRAAAGRAPGAQPPGPAPAFLWSFAGGPQAPPAGELLGGAVVTGGRLRLPAAGAFFRSAPLDREVREKTLEAWVALDTLDQGGGAAIAIEDDTGTTFDAVVYGERQPRKWVAGSSSYHRTRDLQAPVESEPAGTLLHVAVVYRADNRIAVYRNGQPYGEPYTPGGSLRTYLAGRSRVLLGMRHTGGGRPFLTGEIQQAALYDRALEPAEVAASFRAAGLHVTRGEALAMLNAAEKAERAGALARVETLRAELKAIPGGAQSYVGKRQQPEPARVLRRGDLRSPAGVVTPAGLSVLRDTRPEFGLAADAPEAERRRRFADWLADPRNPLPARVMANRVWQFHFGQGLVATPNDLGHAGARPTHPELLDWLAARFIESGWSVKALHRLIVNSDTYRQAGAVPRGRAAALDADNALLWRFPARRLEAEAVRDAILAVSGELNLAMGGPSFRPFDVLKFPANVYQPADKIGPEYNRRTVYRMNVNSGKEPLLDAFDCPDPAVKTPRRGVTITPLQALALMNNAFVQRQAGHLADRVLREAGGDLAGAVREAHRLTLGRDPTREEARRALAAARDRGLTGVCWALLNSTEFLYVR